MQQLPDLYPDELLKQVALERSVGGVAFPCEICGRVERIERRRRFIKLVDWAPFGEEEEDAPHRYFLGLARFRALRAFVVCRRCARRSVRRCQQPPRNAEVGFADLGGSEEASRFVRKLVEPIWRRAGYKSQELAVADSYRLLEQLRSEFDRTGGGERFRDFARRRLPERFVALAKATDGGERVSRRYYGRKPRYTEPRRCTRLAFGAARYCEAHRTPGAKSARQRKRRLDERRDRRG